MNKNVNGSDTDSSENENVNVNVDHSIVSNADTNYRHKRKHFNPPSFSPRRKGPLDRRGYETSSSPLPSEPSPPNTFFSPGSEPFSLPHWVKEVAYVVGFVVTLTVGYQGMKSDQRSTREAFESYQRQTTAQITQLSEDLKSIRSSIPNRELYDRRFYEVDQHLQAVDRSLTDIKDQMDRSLAEIKTQMDIRAMMDQKTREGLIRKGVLE